MIGKYAVLIYQAVLKFFEVDGLVTMINHCLKKYHLGYADGFVIFLDLLAIITCNFFKIKLHAWNCHVEF